MSQQSFLLSTGLTFALSAIHISGAIAPRSAAAAEFEFTFWANQVRTHLHDNYNPYEPTDILDITYGPVEVGFGRLKFNEAALLDTFWNQQYSSPIIGLQEITNLPDTIFEFSFSSSIFAINQDWIQQSGNMVLQFAGNGGTELSGLWFTEHIGAAKSGATFQVQGHDFLWDSWVSGAPYHSFSERSFGFVEFNTVKPLETATTPEPFSILAGAVALALGAKYKRKGQS